MGTRADRKASIIRSFFVVEFSKYEKLLKKKKYFFSIGTKERLFVCFFLIYINFDISLIIRIFLEIYMYVLRLYNFTLQT